MDDPWLIGLFLGLGALLYSSVGHGGASAYIAILTLMGNLPESIRSIALGLNVIVATVAAINYYRQGAFSWRLFWPFALTSIPMALVGGWVAPSFGSGLKVLLGLVLIAAAMRMLFPEGKYFKENREGKSPDQSPSHPPLRVGIPWGGGIGFLSGLTGVGGGIFLSPLLVIGGWASPRMASGVSAPFIVVNSVAGLAALPITFEPLVLPNFLWAAFVLGGGWIGSALGSKHLTPNWLKRLLAVVLFVAAFKMLSSWAFS